VIAGRLPRGAFVFVVVIGRPLLAALATFFFLLLSASRRR
jgi:hypothetical protein